MLRLQLQINPASGANSAQNNITLEIRNSPAEAPALHHSSQTLTSFINPVAHYVRTEILTSAFAAELGMGLLTGFVGGGLGRVAGAQFSNRLLSWGARAMVTHLGMSRTGTLIQDLMSDSFDLNHYKFNLRRDTLGALNVGFGEFIGARAEHILSGRHRAVQLIGGRLAGGLSMGGGTILEHTLDHFITFLEHHRLPELSLRQFVQFIPLAEMPHTIGHGIVMDTAFQLSHFAIGLVFASRSLRIPIQRREYSNPEQRIQHNEDLRLPTLEEGSHLLDAIELKTRQGFEVLSDLSSPVLSTPEGFLVTPDSLILQMRGEATGRVARSENLEALFTALEVHIQRADGSDCNYPDRIFDSLSEQEMHTALSRLDAHSQGQETTTSEQAKIMSSFLHNSSRRFQEVAISYTQNRLEEFDYSFVRISGDEGDYSQLRTPEVLFYHHLAVTLAPKMTYTQRASVIRRLELYVNSLNEQLGLNEGQVPDYYINAFETIANLLEYQEVQDINNLIERHMGSNNLDSSKNYSSARIEMVDSLGILTGVLFKKGAHREAEIHLRTLLTDVDQRGGFVSMEFATRDEVASNAATALSYVLPHLQNYPHIRARIIDRLIEYYAGPGWERSEDLVLDFLRDSMSTVEQFQMLNRLFQEKGSLKIPEPNSLFEYILESWNLADLFYFQIRENQRRSNPFSFLNWIKRRLIHEGDISISDMVESVRSRFPELKKAQIDQVESDLGKLMGQTAS